MLKNNSKRVYNKLKCPITLSPCTHEAKRIVMQSDFEKSTIFTLTPQSFRLINQTSKILVVIGNT